MTLKGFLVGCLSLGLASGSFAQVEYDDMYFNAKDRSELNAMKASGALAMTGKKKSVLEEEFSDNPTDSYSARNINPEHVSRSNSRTAQEDEADYFINNYNHKTGSGYSNWYNGFNNWYNSPWYSSGWYGSGFNSPYYNPYSSYMGSPYNSWGSPWYDSFYSPYGYGGYSPFGYGSGWNVGLSYSFGSPYYPMSMSPWGWSAGYSWYNSWYPRSTVVIVDNDVNGRNVRYGKRPTRDSKAYTNTTTPIRTRNNVDVPSYGRSNSGGRTTTTTAPTSTRQEAYYNKNWRSASQGSATRSSSYNSWSGSNTRSSGYNPGGSSYDRGSNSGRSSYTPSAPQQRSSYSGGSSPSRSTGTGSNGRSRGRD